MSARQIKKRQKLGRNNPNTRERTVTTLTEDPNTPFLVPTPSEEPGAMSSPNVPGFGFGFSNNNNLNSNNSNSNGFNQQFQPQIILPPGQNDLEILEKLKDMIKTGQHEFYRAVPQPAALASIYLGLNNASQIETIPQPDYDTGSNDSPRQRITPRPKENWEVPINNNLNGSPSIAKKGPPSSPILSSTNSAPRFPPNNKNGLPLPPLPQSSSNSSLDVKPSLANAPPLSAGNEVSSRQRYEAAPREQSFSGHRDDPDDRRNVGPPRYYDSRDRDRDRDWERDRDRRYGRDGRRAYEPYDPRGPPPPRRYDTKDELPERPEDNNSRPRISDSRPEDHDRRPPLDDRRPDDRRPLDDRRPPLDDRRPPASDDRRPPASDDRRPAPDDRRAPPDDRRPLPDDRRPLPDDRRAIPPASDDRRPIAPPAENPRPLGERISRAPTLQDRLNPPPVRTESTRSLGERLSEAPVVADRAIVTPPTPASDATASAQDDRARANLPATPPVVSPDDRARARLPPTPTPREPFAVPPRPATYTAPLPPRAASIARDDPRAKLPGPPYRRDLSRERPNSYRPESNNPSNAIDVDARYGDRHYGGFSPPSAADLARDRDRARRHFTPPPSSASLPPSSSSSSGYGEDRDRRYRTEFERRGGTWDDRPAPRYPERYGDPPPRVWEPRDERRYRSPPPPPPSRRPEYIASGAPVDERPPYPDRYADPPPFNRVRPRSPSPPGRSNLPVKRARDDAYPGGAPAEYAYPARRPEFPVPARSPPPGSSSSWGGPPPSSASTVGSDRDRDYPPRDTYYDRGRSPTRTYSRPPAYTPRDDRRYMPPPPRP